MTKLKFTRVLIVTAVSAIIILVFAVYFAGPLSDRGPWKITIATGTKGGTYYPLGQQLARVLEKLPEIEKATSVETAASIENIQLLSTSQADLAFVFRPAIAVVSPAEREEIRVVARLYADVVQIVVRKDAGIYKPTDLNGKRVYVGREGSGTKVIAEDILKTLQVSPSRKVVEGRFSEASQMLIEGALDAAFFAAGKLSSAPKKALESGKCNLLDLRDYRAKIRANIPDLIEVDIPANFYENQTKAIQTVGAEALLMCRKDLDDDLVVLIENALFDNIADLLMAHVRAQDIRFETAFDDLPENVELHPGAIKFSEKEREELLIATGSLEGKYYKLGRKIQMILQQRDIPARVIHTDGSVENAWLLTQRPTLAIMQYDVALTSSWGTPELVYKSERITDEIAIPEVKDLRRIVTLHPERVHIFARRDHLQGDKKTVSTIQALRGNRVCLGPEKSGTRILAQALLLHHNIDLESSTLLSVSAMVDRIHSGEVAAGFFVGDVNASAVKTLLDKEYIRLLSIEPEYITKLIGPVLQATKIADDTFPCQLEGEPAIETLETRAMLVTRENLPFDVQTITEAIFEGAAFLDINPKDLAEDLPSIPLHPAAKRYYQKENYLPSKHSFDWLAATWRSVAIIAILAGGIRGLVHVGRDKTAKRQRRRIYQISLDAGEADSVGELETIRGEIRRSIEKKWWQRGKLDEGRRRDLENSITVCVKEAQSSLTKTILAEIRSINKQNDEDSESRLKRLSTVEEMIGKGFEKGELDELQHSFLTKILEDQSHSKDT